MNTDTFHFFLLKIDIALKSGTMISNAFDVEIGIIISLNPSKLYVPENVHPRKEDE